MNDHDEGLFALDKEAYLAGIQREIDEEIIVDRPLVNRIAALINDDSNEVGQVHFGVIHVLELAEPTAEKREATILNLDFLTPEELRVERENLESWSQICVDHLDQLLK